MSCAPSRSKILSRSLGSSSSIRYCKPEQPPPTTFTRKPLPGFSDESCFILETAFSDSDIIFARFCRLHSQLACESSAGPYRSALRGFVRDRVALFGMVAVGLCSRGSGTLAAPPIGDRRFYSIFGQHRAVNLHRRK